MFTRAIVRKPCRNMIKGLTSSDLGKPDYDLALIQHAAYVEALQDCGLDVIMMEADERYPDSTFVEDTALLTKRCAIITRPGAPSRQGETAAIREVLDGYFDNLEMVQEPGTVEGGDIMMAGSHFYIGLSERTNPQGARQLIGFLEKYGLTGSTLAVEAGLHLKTGLSYLENNTIVCATSFLQAEDFREYRILEIDQDESYAANCVWVNGHVLVAKGYPRTLKMISDAGYPVIELDVSEFQKLDGGLSCLSLRF